MSKNVGFTLAEVLITLAIIGVVAVLVIPALVQNYNARAWNTSATVFERKLGEALNGPSNAIGREFSSTYTSMSSSYRKSGMLAVCLDN